VTLPPEITRGIPRPLREWLNELLRYVRASTPLPGPGTDIFRGTNGSLIVANVPPPAVGGTADTAHPFQILTRTGGTPESPIYYAGVRYESRLYGSLRPDDLISITGLLGENPTPSDPGWFQLDPGDYVWLEIRFNSSGAVVSAHIRNSTATTSAFDLAANAWDEDAFVEDDGDETAPTHEYSKKLIGYSVAGDAGELVVTQSMFRDQLIRAVCVDGRPARYPFDHEGGYPL
jgi:hypothetical protein